MPQTGRFPAARTPIAPLLIVLIAACFALAGAPAAARADASSDHATFVFLQQHFGITATEDEVDQMLASQQLGAAIRADVDCANYGAHALDWRSAAADVLHDLAAADADPAILGTVETALLDRWGHVSSWGDAVKQIHGELAAWVSSPAKIDEYVNTLSKLSTEDDYLSLLSQYYGAYRETGGDQNDTIAQFELDLNLGADDSYLQGIARDHQLSVGQMFDQWQFASTCMNFVQDPDTVAAYGAFISDIGGDIQRYAGAKGLVLVPTASDHVQMINTGAGVISNLQIGQQGAPSVSGGDLDAGQDEQVDGVATDRLSDLAPITFSVDGVDHITNKWSAIQSRLWLGAATEQHSGNSYDFSLSQGPFYAPGIAPIFSWDFGDGVIQRPAPTSVSHVYKCPTTKAVTFTAAGQDANHTTVSASVAVSVGPDFDPSFSTDGTNQSVAPGVPMSFVANPSTPAGSTITWSFGDGTTESGTLEQVGTVQHTYVSAGVMHPTISITPPGWTCASPVQRTEDVTVGRSDQWVPVSNITSDFTMNSSVAGYIVTGTLHVSAGATLTVRPGTNVKFRDNGNISSPNYTAEIDVAGAMDVEGSDAAPAVLTSANDDAAGGACSCGGGSAPASGDWSGIYVESGGSLRLTDAHLRYGADLVEASSGASVRIAGSTFSDAVTGLRSDGAGSLSVSGSTFRAFSSSGISLTSDTPMSPVLSGDTFADEPDGVVATGQAVPKLRGTHFSNVPVAAALSASAARTSLTGTTVDGTGTYVSLGGGTLPSGAVTLGADLPYVVRNLLTVSATTQLTIGAGEVVKFGPAQNTTGELRVDGSLVTAGTTGAPVVLSSMDDDTAGGHCSCSQAGQTARPWNGITIGAQGSARLAGASVRFANTGVQVADGGHAEVVNATFTNDSTALTTTGVADTTIEATTITGPGGGVLFGATAGVEEITDTTFSGVGNAVQVVGGPAALDGLDFVDVTVPVALSAPAAQTTVVNSKVAGSTTPYVSLGSGTLPIGPVTLAADMPYVVSGPLTVSAATELTITGGETLKFGSTSVSSGELLINGGVIAQGTDAKPVVLSSKYDDTAGGHCRCAGTTTAAVGDWTGVVVGGGGDVNLAGTSIRYAGTDLALQDGATATLSSSALTDSGTGLNGTGAVNANIDATRFDKLNVGASFSGAATVTPTIRNSSFSHVGTGLVAVGNTAPLMTAARLDGVNAAASLASTAAATVISGTTVQSGAPYVVLGTGTLPAGATTMQSDLPYVTTGQLTVPTGAHLTLVAGDVMKFAGGSSPGQLVVNGALDAAGTTGQPVVWTSKYDASAGGQCACAGTGTSPATGDWSGLVIGAGGTATLSNAQVRYASTGVDVQQGAAARLAAVTVVHASTGLNANGPSAIEVTGSKFTSDSTAMAFGSSGASYSPAITGATFVADPNAVTVAGSAAPRITESSFEATANGVLSTSSQQVDARGNWWGTATGPRPTGGGAKVTGNVAVAPYCDNDGCVVATVEASPARIVANGRAVTQLTARLSATFSGVGVSGHHVTLSSNDANQSIGAVTDRGDGTYTATLTASPHAGVATVAVRDTDVTPSATGSVAITGIAPVIQASVAPATLSPNGRATATLRATVTANGQPIPGEQVTFASDDPGQVIGPVSDQGDGTYTASLTASTASGAATITASDLSTSPAATATTVVQQTDSTPPTIACESPDASWHREQVALSCTASDAGSGLAAGSPTTFTLATAVPDGTETDNAATASRRICDQAGNCVTAGPLPGNMIDRKNPTATVTTPADGATYTQGQALTAGYACADTGSGVGSCSAPVASGAAISTATTGAKTFTLTATDNVGNTTTKTVSYTVKAAYDPCASTGDGSLCQTVSATPGVKNFWRLDGSTKDLVGGAGYTTTGAEFDYTAPGPAGDGDKALHIQNAWGQGYLTLTPAVDMSGTKPWTIAFWWKDGTTLASRQATAFGYWNGTGSTGCYSSPVVCLFMTSSGALNRVLARGDSSYTMPPWSKLQDYTYAYVGYSITSAPAWTFIAVTYDGSAVRLFKDGALQGQFPSSDSLPANPITRFFTSNDAYWANLAIYDHALTATDLTTQYQAR